MPWQAPRKLTPGRLEALAFCVDCPSTYRILRFKAVKGKEGRWTDRPVKYRRYSNSPHCNRHSDSVAVLIPRLATCPAEVVKINGEHPRPACHLWRPATDFKGRLRR